MDFRYAVTHIKVKEDLQIKKKNLFEVQSNSFLYFF